MARGSKKVKETFKKVSKFCRENSTPFTKEFGRCFKVNWKLVTAKKPMSKKF